MSPFLAFNGMKKSVRPVTIVRDYEINFKKYRRHAAYIE